MLNGLFYFHLLCYSLFENLKLTIHKQKVLNFLEIGPEKGRKVGIWIHLTSKVHYPFWERVMPKSLNVKSPILKTNHSRRLKEQQTIPGKKKISYSKKLNKNGEAKMICKLQRSTKSNFNDASLMRYCFLHFFVASYTPFLSSGM